LASSSSQVEENKAKQRKKEMQRREGIFLQAPVLPFHFWVPLLPSHFCPSVSNAFPWHLLLLKEKKRKEKKNHIEKKKCKEGKELSFKLSLCPLTFGSHFCPPASALPFQTLSLGIFFFSSRRKEKKRETKKKKP